MRRLFRFLSDFSQINKRLEALENFSHLTLGAVAESRRETRTLLSALSLPDASIWQGKPVLPADLGGPGAPTFPNSVVCRQDSFEQPYFAFWCVRLGEYLRYHRKLWEFVFICQALWERGAVIKGARGLGFGVGREPLAAFFASMDCQVTATDMSAQGASDAGWIQSSQHAEGKEGLRRAIVCPDDLFDRNVEFRECDMNAVPDDLTGYDFCWSACALEHLGSIEKGLDFIVRSVECLKPGGWAIHTTELNLTSNDDTVDNMDTVLFRRRDLEALAARLTAMGHHVEPFDFDPGTKPLDNYIDVPPYRTEPHLKIALFGYSITSVGIMVRRGPA